MHTKKEGIMRDDGNPDLEMMFLIAHKKSVAEKIMPVCQSLLHSNQVCLLIQIILQIKIFPRNFLDRNKSEGGSTSNAWVFNKENSGLPGYMPCFIWSIQFLLYLAFQNNSVKV